MRRVFRWTLVGALALGGAAAAASATLNDFKNADGKKGCESIPYEGIRGTCSSKSDSVNDWCKNSSRKISCEGLDPAGLAKQIENVKAKVADLKRERDELSSKISNAKDDSERKDLESKKKEKEDQIYDLEQKISTWERTLSDEKSDISNRIYNGEQCVGYRDEVARAFSDAKQNARSESDPQIKPYADKLVAYWESEESGHATAIRTYKEAVEKCKGMR
jgi:chromosome segregation ATPase